MMTELAEPSAAGILAAIEELPPDASGAFVVATADGRPFGAVLASGTCHRFGAATTTRS